jgi:hypothetical protein
MKKPIIPSVIIALVLLVGSVLTPSYSQAPAKDDTPTFYRLVPGTYVNGWPRFTVHYPREWVEEKPSLLEIFRVAGRDSALDEKFVVQVYPSPLPLDKAAEPLVGYWRAIAQDVTVTADNPSRLTDGTPAREVELRMVMNGLPFRFYRFLTKKGDMWIATGLGSRAEKIDEVLKAFSRSLRFEPDKDDPVKAPADIREFLDRWCSDLVAHDLAKTMIHYSERFLNSGYKKRDAEQYLRTFIGRTTSQEVTITSFVAAGDKAYLAGFVIVNGTIRSPLVGTSLVKEDGEWKWYGNQREAIPGR